MARLTDSELDRLLQQEIDRQSSGLELIPSENYVSQDVLTALGSVFTNKYSEGYPGQRYYAGQANMDAVERIAIERAKSLFGADHANVQPHSGAPANEAVYSAWLEPGDTVLAMDLSHGGHLTHGHPVTRSAKLYNFVRYKMKDVETGEIDYEAMRDLALQHKPKLIVAGFSAYPRELDYSKFVQIGQEVGAVLMADIAHLAGLIAGGVLANPLTAGFHLATSTTHKTLRGPRGGMVLSNGTVGNPMKPVDKTIENLPTLIDRAVFPGMQGGPHMNNTLAKAVALGEAMQPEFKEYAQQILNNAKVLAEELMTNGFKLVTNGTDNHLILANIKESFGIDGAEAETVLDSVGLTLNKNVVPDDTLPPSAPSGVRLGTPAMTTRGMGEPEMKQVAELMTSAIKHRASADKLEEIKQEVASLAERFPIP